MDDNDKVLNYIKNTGINLILNDEDEDNNVADNNDANKEEEVEAEEEEDDNTASVEHPLSNKTFNAMKKLSTFYNPIATNYIHTTSAMMILLPQAINWEGWKQKTSKMIQMWVQKHMTWRKTICQVVKNSLLQQFIACPTLHSI